MQYSLHTRKAVQKRCIEGMNLCQKYISEIKQNPALSLQDDNDIKHLERRFKEFKMSILIVLNTDRIREMRKTLIDGFRAQLADTDPKSTLTGQNREYREKQLKMIERAAACNVPRCNGRGWTGEKLKQGEFQLCNCTLRTLDFYVTMDEPTKEMTDAETAN